MPWRRKEAAPIKSPPGGPGATLSRRSLMAAARAGGVWLWTLA